MEPSMTIQNSIHTILMLNTIVSYISAAVSVSVPLYTKIHNCMPENNARVIGKSEVFPASPFLFYTMSLGHSFPRLRLPGAGMEGKLSRQW